MPPERVVLTRPSRIQEVDNDEEQGIIGTSIGQENDEQTQQETIAEAIRRLEGEKQMLRDQEKLRELQHEVQQMKQARDQRNAAAAHVEVGRQSPREVHVMRGNKPKTKDPNEFQGNSIAEARKFLRTLKVIFANSGPDYSDDRAKVRYGVMWLGGDIAESWHSQYDIEALPEDYTWTHFKTFVRNSIGDPTNRQFSVAFKYVRMKQGRHQAVKDFALGLGVLESQLDYTEPQMARHFLVKLKPSLRMEIVKNHEIPSTRVDMVNLARRLETADMDANSMLAGVKRSAPDAHSTHDHQEKKLRLS